MTDPYDELPYRSRAFAATHVANLATIGVLFGMSPPPPDRARVLELGCASGGNLVPMAVAFPEGAYVGIDRNTAAIDAARERAKRLGADNAVFQVADLEDLPDLGTFDYIIAHGVYSWVSPRAREALLAACRRHLSPQGIAYVSYNTMPGWAHRLALRHMGLFHAGGHPRLDRRLEQLRALVHLVRRATPDDSPLAAVMEAEERHFSGMPDWYVAHEHLGDHNEAFWFHEFIARATAHDLQFLGEAELRDMMPTDLPPDVQADLENLGTDLLRMEQYLDFLRHRTFRRTLLVHREVPLVRDIPLHRADRLHVTRPLADPGASSSPPESPPSGPTDPVAEAVWEILDAEMPASLPFPALVAQVEARTGTSAHDAVAWQILGGLARGAVAAWVVPFPDAVAGSHPVAWRVARDEIAQGETWVTNRRHQGLQLDAYTAALLPLLDGTRDRDAVVEALADAALDGRLGILDDTGASFADRDHAVATLRDGWPRAMRSLRYHGLLE